MTNQNSKYLRRGAFALGAGLAISAPLAAPVTAAPVTAAPVTAAPAMRFPTETGRVVYKLTNTGPAAMAGTISMSWAGSGQRFRQDTEMNLRMSRRAGARPAKISTWTIFDGKALYIATPGPNGPTNRVMRMKLPPNYLQQMMSGALPGMPGAAASGQSGKVVGRATLLGKPCVIRLVNTPTPRGNARVKVWMWQNLPLRTEVAMKPSAPAEGGFAIPPINLTMLATKLDLASKPSAALFKLPTGIQIRDIEPPRARQN